MTTLYRITLDGRGEPPDTLEYMHTREDATDWAECRALGYTVAGLPNGEVVIEATRQKNGDWRLRTDGGSPCWVRVQEIEDE